MPIFEYACDACGRIFEVLVMTPSAGVAKTACDRCGSRRVTRRHSTFSARSSSDGAGSAGGRDAGGGARAGGCGSGSCGCR